MTWFPEGFEHEFFATTAAVSLVATILLLIHINRAWVTFESRGQRLRYVCLLYVSTLVVAAAVEQYTEDAEVQLRNIGTAGFLALLGYTLWVTYREERELRARAEKESNHHG